MREGVRNRKLRCRPAPLTCLSARPLLEPLFQHCSTMIGYLLPNLLVSANSGCVLPCSYHTIPGQALAAADLKDGQTLTTISQQQLTVKVDK